jgi:hypothetical protein
VSTLHFAANCRTETNSPSQLRVRLRLPVKTVTLPWARTTPKLGEDGLNSRTTRYGRILPTEFDWNLTDLQAIFSTLLREWGVSNIQVNEVVPLEALFEYQG